MTDTEKREWLGCHDCGMPYGSWRWMDAHVPDEVWKQISPTADEGGILCISCMAQRCVRMGIETEVQIGSGPFANSRPYDYVTQLESEVRSLQTALESCTREMGLIDDDE
jgi:hypothetical protein